MVYSKNCLSLAFERLCAMLLHNNRIESFQIQRSKHIQTEIDTNFASQHFLVIFDLFYNDVAVTAAAASAVSKQTTHTLLSNKIEIK